MLTNYQNNLSQWLQESSLLLLLATLASCGSPNITITGSLVTVKLGLSREQRIGACVEVQTRCGKLSDNTTRMVFPAAMIDDEVSFSFHKNETVRAPSEVILAKVFLPENGICIEQRKNPANHIVLRYIWVAGNGSNDPCWSDASPTPNNETALPPQDNAKAPKKPKEAKGSTATGASDSPVPASGGTPANGTGGN